MALQGERHIFLVFLGYYHKISTHESNSFCIAYFFDNQL